MSSRDTREVMLDWGKKGVAAALAGAILLSAPGAVRSVSGSTATSASSTVGISTTAVAAQNSSQRVLSAVSAVSPNATLNGAAADAQKRINIRPVLDWIRWAAPYVWNAMVNAVKWGWNAFINWWNGLAAWIRNTINWFIGGALWDFFLELRRYFFGW